MEAENILRELWRFVRERVQASEPGFFAGSAAVQFPWQPRREYGDMPRLTDKLSDGFIWESFHYTTRAVDIRSSAKPVLLRKSTHQLFLFRKLRGELQWIHTFLVEGSSVPENIASKAATEQPVAFLQQHAILECIGRGHGGGH